MPYTSVEKMSKIFKDASYEDVEKFHEVFSEFHHEFMIQTETHEQFFLAQIIAENGTSLKFKRENLNYSCDALSNLFSYYKKNPKEARIDGRCNSHKARQRTIGNKIYANRIGNGDVSSGDGYKYRGGGPLQLTGKSNYNNMASVIQKTTGDAIDSENLERGISSFRLGLLSAFAFWLDNELYSCQTINCVTRKINRYTSSYKERENIYLSIKEL